MYSIMYINIYNQFHKMNVTTMCCKHTQIKKKETSSINKTSIILPSIILKKQNKRKTLQLNSQSKVCQLHGPATLFVKFCQNTVTLTHYIYIHGSFSAVTAKLNKYNPDHMSEKPKVFTILPCQSPKLQILNNVWLLGSVPLIHPNEVLQDSPFFPPSLSFSFFLPLPPFLSS